VVAVSPTALQAGVRCGWTVGRAQSLCPELLLFPRDATREALAWDEVQRALYGLTPRLESLAPGLLCADVEAEGVLPLVRGWGLRAGFAHDRATAHLAALTVPASTLRRVPPGQEAAFCDQTPLVALVGLGAKKERVSAEVVRRLGWFGWRSVGALRVLSRRQLEEQCGAAGAVLWRYAQGARLADNRRGVPVWMPPAEISARLSFVVPAREPCEWESALDEILCRVCAELETRRAGALEVRVETMLSPLRARRVLRDPLNAPRSLQAPARAAMAEALAILAPLPPVVQGLEVHLGALTMPAQPLSLFDDLLGDTGSRQRKLQTALESVEARFGGRVGKYVPREPHSPWPEDAFGWLPALQAIEGQRREEGR
jgi:hypothetical protein